MCLRVDAIQRIPFTESSQKNHVPEFKNNHTSVYRSVPFLNITEPSVSLKPLWVGGGSMSSFEGDSPFGREANHTLKY